MTILYLVLYLVATIVTFCFLVHIEKKSGNYVDVVLLFFFTVVAVVWPFIVLIALIFKLYEKLEEWINRK